MKLKLYQIIVLVIAGLVLFVAWIEYEQRFVVKGRVVDAEGRPVASVKVQCDGAHDAAVTDVDGRFRFEHVAPGRRRLRPTPSCPRRSPPTLCSSA